MENTYTSDSYFLKDRHDGMSRCRNRDVVVVDVAALVVPVAAIAAVALVYVDCSEPSWN